MKKKIGARRPSIYQFLTAPLIAHVECNLRAQDLNQNKRAIFQFSEGTNQLQIQLQVYVCRMYCRSLQPHLPKHVVRRIILGHSVRTTFVKQRDHLDHGPHDDLRLYGQEAE